MNLKQAKTLMTQDEFWDIIAKSNKGENLHEVLSELSDDELFGYCHWWNYFNAISYKSDLWAVAYVAMGGCSDDSFDYFRFWLVAQGQEVFENAMVNADSLCDVFDEMEDDDFPKREDYDYIVRKIIDKRHGDDVFYKTIELYSDLYTAYPEFEFDWDEDDENSIRQICPKTFDKWWDSDKLY